MMKKQHDTTGIEHRINEIETQLKNTGDILFGSLNLKKTTQTTRRLLKHHGAATVLKHLRQRHGPLCAALPGDAPSAWRYLGERAAHMNYGWLRRHGYFIGTGLAEAACRTLVCRRCKQSGMHWRHANAAAIRSGTPITI